MGHPWSHSPDWQLGEDEHRPVGTIAHHVAAIIGVPHLAMIRDAAEGRPLELVQGWTVAAVAAGNAQFAQQHAKVTKAQALELLKAIPPGRWSCYLSFRSQGDTASAP